MKKIIFFGVFMMLCITGFCQNIYNRSFTNIDGGNVSLSSYLGYKLVFMIAPIDSTDSIRLDEMKAFQFRHSKDSVKLIGIMSFEDGYLSGNKSAIKNLYQSSGIDIILTDGMYTRKASGTSQSSVMQWLTTKSLNGTYNKDAMGVGHKFIVTKAGKISGTVSPGETLLSTSVGWALYKQ